MRKPDQMAKPGTKFLAVPHMYLEWGQTDGQHIPISPYQLSLMGDKYLKISKLFPLFKANRLKHALNEHAILKKQNTEVSLIVTLFRFQIVVKKSYILT